MAFRGESTTDDVLEGIRLDGKHAVVTGATGGLGIETARALASVGASVTICGRNPETACPSPKYLDVDGRGQQLFFLH